MVVEYQILNFFFSFLIYEDQADRMRGNPLVVLDTIARMTSVPREEGKPVPPRSGQAHGSLMCDCEQLPLCESSEDVTSDSLGPSREGFRFCASCAHAHAVQPALSALSQHQEGLLNYSSSQLLL